MRLAPHATATLESPLLNTCTASCTATSDDEQAVSIVIEGPCQSKKYDTRLDMMLLEIPVAVYWGRESQSLIMMPDQSSHIWPT